MYTSIADRERVSLSTPELIHQLLSSDNVWSYLNPKKITANDSRSLRDLERFAKELEACS